MLMLLLKIIVYLIVFLFFGAAIYLIIGIFYLIFRNEDKMETRDDIMRGMGYW